MSWTKKNKKWDKTLLHVSKNKKITQNTKNPVTDQKQSTKTLTGALDIKHKNKKTLSYLSENKKKFHKIQELLIKNTEHNESGIKDTPPLKKNMT